MKFVCRKGYEVEALKSGAGYYIGTIDYSEGYPQPNCRISEDYFKTKEEAQMRLEYHMFNFRFCAENEWCSFGNCLIKEVEE